MAVATNTQTGTVRLDTTDPNGDPVAVRYQTFYDVFSAMEQRITQLEAERDGGMDADVELADGSIMAFDLGRLTEYDTTGVTPDAS